MKSAINKNERIFENLREQIVAGTLSPGEMIPSQAALMREYGVALGTVRQALNRLQVDGLIVSKHGKGCFVRARSAHWNTGASAGAVGLVAFDGTDVAEYDHLMTMRESLAAANLELMVGVFGLNQAQPALEWARKLSGVIVRNRPPTEFIHLLVEHKIPAVLLGNMYGEPIPPEISHIRFQLHSAMDQAVQFLGNLGHRHIYFVNRQIQEGARYPEFLHQLSSLFSQIVPQRIPSAITEEINLNPGEEHLLIEKLNAASTAPTALLIEGGQRACTIMHELERAGWSAPQRISIVAISPLQSSKFATPGLSYVELPMQEMSNRGAAVMIEMLHENHLVRESIAPCLHWGNTCRNLAH